MYVSHMPSGGFRSIVVQGDRLPQAVSIGVNK
jgi:hypothetical protein